MKKICLLATACFVLAACASVKSGVSTAVSTVLPQAHDVPSFDHIVLILLENRRFDQVIGRSSSMHHLNDLARKNVLLSNYFAVSHPSLPNYIALVSGSTDNIKSDCISCFVNQPNLADLLDASGHTWKTYQEDMPSPCFVGDAKPYYQKHNPFIYFDSIRLNASRCDRSVVPLTTLDSDLASNQLPNFSLIMPNYCNSGHSCPGTTADNWAFNMVNKLRASPALGSKSLIIVTFDEGAEGSDASCCGLGGKGGGQVATILISPLAKSGFQDTTPYSHYSLLKTILMAWKLPALGDTSPAATQPILAPWLPGTSWNAPASAKLAAGLAYP
jgi:phosphatidylinositol-3-phosphatase